MVLSWLVGPPCGAVLAGGTTMWCCVGWWNHHVVLCWLVESPCGAVLAGGITMWHSVGWWNHYVVLCWLMECTVICGCFQHITECNLLRLLTTDMFLHPRTCVLPFCESSGRNPPVCRSVPTLYLLVRQTWRPLIR